MSEPNSDRITVWWCDECGYWRQHRSTGVHQTDNPDDWRGKQLVHPDDWRRKQLVHQLRPREFVAVPDKDAR